MADIDFSKCKKKKKHQSDVNEVELVSRKDQVINNADQVMVPVEDIDFSKSKKKKKTIFCMVEDVENIAGGIPEEFIIPIDYMNKRKKRRALFEIEVDVDGDLEEENDVIDHSEYDYEIMLERVYRLLTEKNPDMLQGEKKRLRMVPPILARVGTKKTLFTNFLTTTKMIHREPQHVMQFLLNEMGTTGSIDQNTQLLIRGRYQSKQIESLLKNYARAYVICKTCQSPDTQLSKDSRLLFLICNSCGSKYSVDTHTAGFQAVTTKRAAIRAKIQ